MKTSAAVGSTLAILSALATPGVADERLPGAPDRDLASIRALAGTYSIEFDFHETVAVQPKYKLHEPYTTTAPAELVAILADEPRFISLQHVLVMNGEVMKHWREDWLYECVDLYEFAGRGTWAHRRLTEAEARGTWTQRVYQVDDSPRYQGYGRWVHSDGLSAWESNWTWRPLPRREFKKRDDYDVLISRSRITLTPSGWVHEQDNAKLALRGAAPSVLARETGLDTYTRIAPAMAEDGRRYWEKTRAFWAEVRSVWDGILVPGATVTLQRMVDGKTLWERISDLEGKPVESEEPLAGRIRQVLDQYIVAPEGGGRSGRTSLLQIESTSDFAD